MDIFKPEFVQCQTCHGIFLPEEMENGQCFNCLKVNPKNTDLSLEEIKEKLDWLYKKGFSNEEQVGLWLILKSLYNHINNFYQPNPNFQPVRPLTSETKNNINDGHQYCSCDKFKKNMDLLDSVTYTAFQHGCSMLPEKFSFCPYCGFKIKEN